MKIYDYNGKKNISGNRIREVRPWAVAGAAPDDLVGVGDVDVVFE